jgi:uncharacterized protein (DUF736 family)
MNNQNENNEWAKRDIGALWRREGKNQKYLSGYVKFDEFGVEREVKIVVFSNKSKKDNVKAPDYRIYISKPVENKNQKTETSAQIVKQKSVSTPKRTPLPQQEEEDDLL